MTRHLGELICIWLAMTSVFESMAARMDKFYKHLESCADQLVEFFHPSWDSSYRYTGTSEETGFVGAESRCFFSIVRGESIRSACASPFEMNSEDDQPMFGSWRLFRQNRPQRFLVLCISIDFHRCGLSHRSRSFANACFQHLQVEFVLNIGFYMIL